MTFNLGIYTTRDKFNGIRLPPMIKVYIKSCTRDIDSRSFITPNCVGEREFDQEIDRLHRELEELRKSGKRILREGN